MYVVVVTSLNSENKTYHGPFSPEETQEVLGLMNNPRKGQSAVCHPLRTKDGSLQ